MPLLLLLVETTTGFLSFRNVSFGWLFLFCWILVQTVEVGESWFLLTMNTFIFFFFFFLSWLKMILIIWMILYDIIYVEIELHVAVKSRSCFKLFQVHLHDCFHATGLCHAGSGMCATRTSNDGAGPLTFSPLIFDFRTCQHNLSQLQQILRLRICLTPWCPVYPSLWAVNFCSILVQRGPPV